MMDGILVLTDETPTMIRLETNTDGWDTNNDGWETNTDGLDTNNDSMGNQY